MLRRRRHIYGPPHRGWLTLAAGAVSIGLARAATARRWLLHYFRSALCINGRRRLHWTIGSRHLCLHIIIREDTPIAVESATIIVIAAADPSRACARVPCPRNRVVHPSPVRGVGRTHDASSGRSADDNSVMGRRRHRCAESGRRINPAWSGMPSVPPARLPAPSPTVDEDPVAVAVGQPSPRIRRNPRISKAGGVNPISVNERVPSQAH